MDVNKVTEIKDSYYVSYAVFYSMGVLVFIPFHFFAIATDYWMFKFRDPDAIFPGPDANFPGKDKFLVEYYKLEKDVKENGPANERTQLQASFTSSFYITSQVSMLGFLIVTALFSNKLPSAATRIKGALFSMLVLFLINSAFTKINTDSFQEVFFGLSLLLGILLNIASAVVMISLFELVTKFPIDYYGTILSGQALCGVASALLQITILSAQAESITSGLIFFLVGSFIILLTTIFYLITKKKSKYFIYRISQSEEAVQEQVEPKCVFNKQKMKSALQRIKWYLGAMVFIQGSSAMVHPGLTALIVSVDEQSELGNEWHKIYFVPVITFLGFNLFDFTGREVARRIKRPRNAFVILALASARLVLVPLLMLCNAQPRKHMPVFFEDNFYMILICIFGLTQGYLVNLCIIAIPRVARKEELEFVSVLLPLFSVLSAFLCSAFNLILISLI